MVFNKFEHEGIIYDSINIQEKYINSTVSEPLLTDRNKCYMGTF